MFFFFCLVLFSDLIFPSIGYGMQNTCYLLVVEGNHVQDFCPKLLKPSIETKR